MKPISAERLAKLGITIQFMALVRCLFEYYRLKRVSAVPLTLGAVEPFLTGALIAALCTWIAVVFFFLGRHKIVIVVSAGTVVLLLAYKIYVFR
jgi:hypothetical protein